MAFGESSASLRSDAPKPGRSIAKRRASGPDSRARPRTAVLQSWLRAPSVRAGLAQRARIVLLAADGVAVKDIVERVGVSKPTVIGWKKRYAAEGIGGLEDRQARPSSGGRRGRGRLGHARTPARAVGRDALVDPAAGCGVRDLACVGGQDLAPVGPAAVAC